MLKYSGDCTKWGIISKNDVNKNIRETGAYNIELLRSNSSVYIDIYKNVSVYLCIFLNQYIKRLYKYIIYIFRSV